MGWNCPSRWSILPLGRCRSGALVNTVELSPVIEAKGARIPLLGLGTWELRGRTCARVVEQALRIGYRHLDTAQMYGNEREVGRGCTRPASNAARFSSRRKSGRAIL